VSACIETTWPRDRDGYGRRWIDHVKWKAHRWAWAQAHGPIPAGMQVLHHCDNPPCIKTEPDDQWPDGHLFLGTQADNNRDMAAKGRAAEPRGERNPRAKLSERDVLVIRERSESGDSARTLAAAFGVRKEAIRQIVIGRRWTHLACLRECEGRAS
jgi:hypothetical protein